jgi:hypothetical protein
LQEPTVVFLETLLAQKDMPTLPIGGAVRLLYDNAEKLATTATGIDVTGTVTADGLITNTAGTATL